MVMGEPAPAETISAFRPKLPSVVLKQATALSCGPVGTNDEWDRLGLREQLICGRGLGNY